MGVEWGADATPLSAEFWFVYLVLYDSGHAQLDCVALVLFCGPYDQGQVRNISAQPDQIICFRMTIF